MSRVPSLAEARRRAEATRRVKPDIEAPSGPAAIRALREAINAGKIPSTYVSSGRVVAVEKVSGTAGAAAGDEDSPLPVTASEVRAPELAALLAEHTNTYRIRSRKTPDGGTETYEEEVTPPMPVLNGCARPEGVAGPAAPATASSARRSCGPTGPCCSSPATTRRRACTWPARCRSSRCPRSRTAGRSTAAREFLLTAFLGDFPWVSEADKANYLGLLVTPILRSYLRTLIPFGVVTSTMPGSGKTILTCGLGMLYGQRVLTWTHSDEELRKAITSVLADPVGTIIFDNLAEGTVIDSPVLARLITDRTWADRLLGGNKTAAFANDRVWTATGNNLRLGGDMRTRSVLVGLNPDMPRPEERTGFQIPDLDQWILATANQRPVLWHLLVLVADWTRAGAPRRAGLTMRQFTPWAEAVGGFLAHHGIPGFLANVETVRDIDEEESTWTAFFAQWRKVHGDQWLTSNQLRLSADVVTDAAGRPSTGGTACSVPTAARIPRQRQVPRQAAHRPDQPLPRLLCAAQPAGQAQQSQHLARRGVVGVSGVCGALNSAPAASPLKISRARAGNTDPAAKFGLMPRARGRCAEGGLSGSCPGACRCTRRRAGSR